MDKRLIWGPLLIIALYTVIPWVLSRMFGVGAFTKGKTPGKVSFTFDDGPDPHYTPLLLDLLKQYRVRATFFVVGERAEKHPDIIRRIVAEGHEIGIHNYNHISNWILTPWRVRKQQVERALDAVEKITGKRPALYRPPWGVINLFDFRLHKDLTTVLWSVMGGDWSCKSEEDEHRLAKRLARRVKDGSVVLLHDCGETLGARPEAPKYMLGALRTVLEQFQSRNFSYIPVGELIEHHHEENGRCISRTRRLIVNLWLGWERLFVKVFNIVPIDENNPMLKLRVRKYAGDEPIVLSDGEVIRKGDRIAELHLNNELLFELGMNAKSTMHLMVQLIRRMEQLLPQTLQMLMNHPDFKEVKGLYGITIIHRGTHRFGFTVVDLPKGVFSVFTKLYLRLLLYVVHPQGKERIQTKTELLVPKIIAISKQELKNRYLSTSP